MMCRSRVAVADVVDDDVATSGVAAAAVTGTAEEISNKLLNILYCTAVDEGDRRVAADFLGASYGSVPTTVESASCNSLQPYYTP